MSRRQVSILVAVIVAVSAVVIVATQTSSGRTGGDAGGAPTTTVAPNSTTTSTPSTTTTSTTTTTTTTIPPATVAVDQALSAMSLDEKAAQLVVVGASGADVSATIVAEVGSVCVGGVFVRDNAGNWTPRRDIDAATAAIGKISAAAADCAARPFITTDAEAGTRVLKVPVDPLPDPATLLANHQADSTTTSEGLAGGAVAFAAALGEAGVHVNLGVIADVDGGPDFYMAREGRSFGGDPADVTAITEAMVEGHCAAGVAPTLKHFPNQGSTVEDPHQLNSLSVNDEAGWYDFGRVPYAATRAPLIMTGHIRYAGVDEQRPATLSSVITTGWLRDGLQYEGVIITDDLHGMRGVTAEAPAAARGAAAIAAGADLALYVGADELGNVIGEIVQRAQSDPAFAERIDESVRRVLRLKGALGLLGDADPSWFELCR